MTQHTDTEREALLELQLSSALDHNACFCVRCGQPDEPDLHDAERCKNPDVFTIANAVEAYDRSCDEIEDLEDEARALHCAIVAANQVYRALTPDHARQVDGEGRALGEWRWYVGHAEDDDEMMEVGGLGAAVAEALRQAQPGAPAYIIEGRMFVDDEAAMGRGDKDTAPFAESRSGCWIEAPRQQHATPVLIEAGEDTSFVAGPIWREEEEETECWTAEVQIVGGHAVVARVHGGSQKETAERQKRVIAALSTASPPRSLETAEVEGLANRLSGLEFALRQDGKPLAGDLVRDAIRALRHPQPSTPVGMGDTVCQSCGADNPIWFAPSPLWNLVMGGPEASDDPGGVVCPSCFMRRAKALGIAPTGWFIQPDPERNFYGAETAQAGVQSGQNQSAIDPAAGSREAEEGPSTPEGEKVEQSTPVADAGMVLPSRVELAKVIDPTAWRLDRDGYHVEQVHSGDALAKADAILSMIAAAPDAEGGR